MPRARNIKPGVCKNMKLAKLSPHARILFRDLPMFADHEGRLVDCHETIRAEIFPFEPSLNVDHLLDELNNDRFIVRYQAQPLPEQDPLQSRFIWIVNFTTHQHPHKNECKTPSKFPPFREKLQTPVNNGTALVNNEIDPADSLNLSPDSLIPHSDSEEREPPADPYFKDHGQREFAYDHLEAHRIVEFSLANYKATDHGAEILPFAIHLLASGVTEQEIEKALEAKAEMFPEAKYRPNFKKALANAAEVKRLASGEWKKSLENQQKPNKFRLDEDDVSGF